MQQVGGLRLLPWHMDWDGPSLWPGQLDAETQVYLDERKTSFSTLAAQLHPLKWVCFRYLDPGLYPSTQAFPIGLIYSETQT